MSDRFKYTEEPDYKPLFPKSSEEQKRLDAATAKLEKELQRIAEARANKETVGNSETWEKARAIVMPNLENTLVIGKLIYSPLFKGAKIDSDTAITLEELTADKTLLGLHDLELVRERFKKAANEGLNGGEAINPYRSNNCLKLVTPLLYLFEIEDKTFAEKLFGTEDARDYTKLTLELKEKIERHKSDRTPMSLTDVETVYAFSSHILATLSDYEKNRK